MENRMCAVVSPRVPEGSLCLQGEVGLCGRPAVGVSDAGTSVCASHATGGEDTLEEEITLDVALDATLDASVEELDLDEDPLFQAAVGGES